MSNAKPPSEFNSSQSEMIESAEFAAIDPSDAKAQGPTLPGTHRWGQIVGCIRTGLSRAQGADAAPPPKAPARLAPKKDRVGFASGFSLLD